MHDLMVAVLTIDTSDTDAIGVLVVHIHRATGVKQMDATGGSGM